MRFTLVSLGNEESYGLLFAAEEVKKRGEIRFVDAEMSDPVEAIRQYRPNYVCFSPLTVFYPQAARLETRLRSPLDFISIYGGPHAAHCGEPLGDITVVGAVHDLDLARLGIQRTQPDRSI
jgi:hypothetical protein